MDTSALAFDRGSCDTVHVSVVLVFSQQFGLAYNIFLFPGMEIISADFEVQKRTPWLPDRVTVDEEKEVLICLFTFLSGERDTQFPAYFFS